MFQQRQCQSHYALGPEVTAVTGRGLRRWPGDKRQGRRGMTGSSALCNSQPGGDLDGMTHQGGHLEKIDRHR